MNANDDVTNDDLRLWYRQPAADWVEALPVGNGRLGGMVFGGIGDERIQLNEDTLWSGAPGDGNNPEAREILPEMRRALFAGEYKAADALCQKMQGPYTQSYQPLGNLYLDFDGHDGLTAQAVDYYRELDIARAVAATRYRFNDALYGREIFASAPDQVLVVHLTCDRPGGLSFTARLDSLLRHAVAPSGGDRLLLTGRCPRHVAPNYVQGAEAIVYDDALPGDGMTFTVAIQAVAEGGTVSGDANALLVTGASRVTLLLSAATSFNGFDRSPGRDGKDSEAIALGYLEAAAKKPYAALREAHKADYDRLFGRVTLDLGGIPDAQSLPTDTRIHRFHETDDPGLAALLYQYGRYLLIACSRPGTQPANLQGIWNDKVRPPWSSNYTININTQMNYWPAEMTNLSECHEPLLDFIADLAMNGAKTARINYGCAGWVAHHNADLWRQSNPVGAGRGRPIWANWTMGGGWLCQHLWEHYAYTGDREYLRERAWPLMRSAAEFCLDWLIEDADKRLVTAPSISPEVGFLLPDGSGEEAETAIAATMDMAIIHDLFTNGIAACRTLGVDADFAARLEAARERLYPPTVGARGQLQEWAGDLQEAEVHHRHVSHLFGVFPGRQITPETTPETTPTLLQAARRSLEIRGDAGTGWSLAWKINFWARLRDGNHAYGLVRNLLTLVETQGENRHKGGGVYANLFDAHPPFQIDGNFGYTSGVTEMLLQSHQVSEADVPEIHLLPALPGIWRRGRVTGLRARGGFVVDIAWNDGHLTEVALRCPLPGDNPCRLRCGDTIREVTVPQGKEGRRFNGGLDRIT